jgi:hypothetical protein
MHVLQRDVRRLKNELQRRDTADADKVRELSIAKEDSAICRATLQNIERQLLEDRERANQITQDLKDANEEVAILREKHAVVERQRLEDSKIIRQLTDELNAVNIREKNNNNVKRQEERKGYKRINDAKAQMCKIFGWIEAVGKLKKKGWAECLVHRRSGRCSARCDDDLMDAALGFWMGCQKYCVGGKIGKAGPRFRKDLLYDIVKYGFKGELWKDIVKEIKQGCRASPVLLAKKQDTESAFNSRAVQGMRECLPGYAKGVHGLCVPSQSCINIEKEIAYEASAAAFGSEFPAAENGEVWKWDMKKGVHMYLKKMYCDIKLDSAIKERRPIKVVATGDAARMSQRGHTVTVCGLKIVDERHPEQVPLPPLPSRQPALSIFNICTSTELQSL